MWAPWHPEIQVQMSPVLRSLPWCHAAVSLPCLAVQLRQYAQQYGDAHVGHRDSDDPELSKWAAKQRSMQRRGELEPARAARLQVRRWGWVLL